MKNIALFLLTGFIVKWGPVQVKPLDAGSSVQFKIKNLGFTVNGSFTGLQGNIRFDPSHLPDAAFEVSVDVSTVNTDNSLRDDHLRNEDYFNVKVYPLIRLVSTKVTPSNKANEWFFSGQLTIKNQTRPIQFPFTAIATNQGWQFAGSFNINRRDFGVGGPSIISDKLDVSLNIFAK